MAQEKAEKEKKNELPSALSAGQKMALIGAAAIIAIVLGMAFFTPAKPIPISPSVPSAQPASADNFSSALYSSNSIGIFMDLRGSQDGQLRQKILQCGADIAGNIAGARPFGSKELVIAACDEGACILSFSKANDTKNSTQADVDSELAKTVYFHILGGESKEPSFYTNRVDMTISPLSNTSCKIGVVEEVAPNIGILGNVSGIGMNVIEIGENASPLEELGKAMGNKTDIGNIAKQNGS